MACFQISRATRLLAIIAIAFAFFVTEIAVGFSTHSLALIADSFHYLSDLMGFVVALVALKISERNDSPKSLSFGWQRAQFLGAFFNGVFLVALGLSIFLQSIERFVTMQKMRDPLSVLVMGCVGLMLNIISALFLHEHHHHGGSSHDKEDDHQVELEDGKESSIEILDTAHPAHLHHKHHKRSINHSPGRDLGMLGVLLHVVSDAINNVGVILAAVAIHFGKSPSRFYADPGVSMGISFMIILSAVPLIRSSGSILLQSAPVDVDLEDIKHDLELINGVVSVHELHVWRLSHDKSVATAHVVVKGTDMADFMKIAEARLHVVVWYVWLSLTVTILAVRAFHLEMQQLLSRIVFTRQIPFSGRHLTIGAILMMLWILALYGVIIGIWWARLYQYFVDRSAAGGIERGGNRLAAVALTGHLCDVTMGITLIPISRHSALASFFQLAVSSTLTMHMLAAYTLFILVLLHAALYVSWVSLFNGLSAQARMALPVLNPTYLFHETWPGNRTSLGVWRASLIFTGLLATVIMGVIAITTLPQVRRKNFNLFYFTHLSSIVMVIIICLHASTMFYCTAPGLAMWCLDWSMRLHELRKRLRGQISFLGNGWYCITVPIPRSRLAGCSCRSPLAHFFIHHGDSSKREVHPFTTITHLAASDATTSPARPEIVVQFLFRRVGAGVMHQEPTGHQITLFNLLSGRSKKPAAFGEWTDKLASSLDHALQEQDQTGLGSQELGLPASVDLDLRLEGPYFSPADPSRYHTVVCLVAGTGISGAIAIACAYDALHGSHRSINPEHPRSPSSKAVWQRCIINWSVRETDYVALPYLDRSQDVEVQTCFTGQGKPRLDVQQFMSDIQETTPPNSGIWTYISGPKGFIENAKTICKALPNVDVHAASWEI
ncbi:MAG: hypothetical protein Q9219_006650 [cf. Caloplaca sp. 3 TL-2023]